MPCNTVHCFIDDLKEFSDKPVLSIVDEVVKKLKKERAKNVGIIASESTLRNGFYSDQLKKQGISVILPEKEDFTKITGLILEIMSGKYEGSSKSKVIGTIQKFGKKNADAVLLGCTEIPLAINSSDVDNDLHDSLSILAESTLEFAKNG